MNSIIDPQTVEQGSPEWLQLRLGCVSASTIADVMAKGKSGESATRQKLKLRLAAERLTGQVQESFSSPAMDWAGSRNNLRQWLLKPSVACFLIRLAGIHTQQFNG